MASYNHSIRYAGYGCYDISWVVDFKYNGSRLRYPRCMKRNTDLNGAKRFAKKWGIDYEFEQEGATDEREH